MNDQPTVSVLLPVYNAERYLREAVESVLAQTFTDFELLVVDDGSTDGSLAILREFERRDPRVRVISRPNTGYVVALNEMLGLAKGEFIARMDADDVCMPERFTQQLSWFSAHTDGVACGTWVLAVDAEGDPLTIWRGPEDHKSVDQAHLRGQGGTIIHPASMMRVAALRRLGGYRRELEPAEDLDLFLRLAEIGSIGNVPLVLLRYRHHLMSVSHTRSREQIRKAGLATKDARRRRGLTKSTDEAELGREEEAATAIEFKAVLTRKWAWWALGAGYLRTGRKHAWSNFRSRPLTFESWKLVYCAMRGR